MTAVLEVEYREMSEWALGIRTAIQNNPTLTVRDAWWSEGPLSDLAFAISTRLGCLPDVIALVEENLHLLGDDLTAKGEAVVDEHLAGAYAYRFNDYRVVRRVIVGVDLFIAESRACFEHLADFYREFVKTYFDETTGTAASYAAIAKMAKTSAWADSLKAVRDKILHERSVWLAFEVRAGRHPRYEPLLLLNWRPGMYQPEDCVQFQTLRDIRTGLEEAAGGLRAHLIERVSGRCST